MIFGKCKSQKGHKTAFTVPLGHYEWNVISFSFIMLQVNFRTLRMTFLIHIQVSESHRLLLSKKKKKKISESKWSILMVF